VSDADSRAETEWADLLRDLRDAARASIDAGGSPVISDPHDPRLFRLWATFTPYGVVRATHAFLSNVEQPLPGAIEITSLAPADFTRVQIDPALLVTRASAEDQYLQGLAATDLARANFVESTNDVVSAMADSLAREATPM
jgi:hypothetical protein